MNRREFFKGLFSLPLGWKALFRKEETKGLICLDEEAVEVDEGTWSKYVELLVEGSMQDEVGPCIYADGSVIGRIDGSMLGAMRDVLDQCECPIDTQIHTSQCESEPYILGQWSYYQDICRWLSEIIERDAPNMLLEGSADVDIISGQVFIRYPCGPSFQCPDIEAEKTEWYKRIERQAYNNDGLVAVYEWEPINES